MMIEIIIILISLVIIGGLVFRILQITRQLDNSKKELASDQDRFKFYAENTDSWFWETDDKFRITYLSSQFQDVIGNLTKIYMGSVCQKAFASHMEKPEQRGVFSMYLESHKGFKNLEVKWKSSTGKSFSLQMSAQPVFDAANQFSGFRGTIQDVSEKKQLKAQVLATASSAEGTTMLINRSMFDEHLKRAIVRARDRGQYTVMCQLDLDNFKPIKDVAGEKACEEFLTILTATIQSKVRSRDSLTRISAEKFCLLLENCPLDKAAVIANGLIMDIGSLNFSSDEENYDVTASIGLIVIDGDIDKPNELIALGNKACLEAKSLGGNQVYIPQLG